MCFIVEFQNYADWTAGRQELLSENVPLLDLTCVRASAARPIIPRCPMLRYHSPRPHYQAASLPDGLTCEERREAIRVTDQ